MTVDELVRVCEAYKNLGWAVQEQVQGLVNGNVGDQNPNAVRMIVNDFLSVAKRVGDPELVEDVEAVEEEIKAVYA